MSNDLGITTSRKNSGFVIAARFASDCAGFLTLIALSSFIYSLTKNAYSVAIILACRVTGGMLAGFLSSPFYRAWPGKRSLLIVHAIRAVAIAMALLPSAFILPYWLYIISFVLGAASSTFAIGLNSQIPRLVLPEHLLKTNAWITSLASCGAVAGSVAAGLIVAVAGFDALFGFASLLYLVAMIATLPLSGSWASPSPFQFAFANDLRRLRTEIVAVPALGIMLLVTMFDTFGSAAHNVAFPVFSAELSQVNASTVMGFILAVWALGKLIGSRLCTWLCRRDETDRLRLERIFFAGVALMSFSFILAFRQSIFLPSFLLMGLAGVGDGLAEVAVVTRIQKEPDSLRLPVFSLLTVLQQSGFGVGMLVSAPFFSLLKVGNVVLLFHGLPVVAATFSLCWLRFKCGRPTKETSSI